MLLWPPVTTQQAVGWALALHRQLGASTLRSSVVARLHGFTLTFPALCVMRRPIPGPPVADSPGRWLVVHLPHRPSYSLPSFAAAASAAATLQISAKPPFETQDESREDLSILLPLAWACSADLHNVASKPLPLQSPSSAPQLLWAPQPRGTIRPLGLSGCQRCVLELENHELILKQTLKRFCGNRALGSGEGTLLSLAIRVSMKQLTFENGG